MSSTTSLDKLKKLVMAAMFVAVAYVFRFVFHFNAMFLTFEFKDAVIAIGAMFLGPLWGVGIAIVVAFVEFITISDTGVYGLIMNVLAASVYAGVSGLIYKYKRTLSGAAWSLGAGTAALVAVMLPANLLITPHFMGATVEAVIGLIPKLLFPFNLIKGVMNSGVVLLLYKPITRALRAVKLAENTPVKNTVKVAPRAETAPEGAEDAMSKSPNLDEEATAHVPVQTEVVASRKSAFLQKQLVPVIAILLMVASILFFFLFLHGNISFGK